jgi:hypothetical protein
MSPERGRTLTALPEGERAQHPLFPGGAVSVTTCEYGRAMRTALGERRRQTPSR